MQLTVSTSRGPLLQVTIQYLDIIVLSVRLLMTILFSCKKQP